MSAEPWSDIRGWAALRAGLGETIVVDGARRAAIAKRLDLESLDSLVASIVCDAWLDGARVHSRIEAAAAGYAA